MDKNYTIYQRLQKVISGKNIDVPKNTNTYRITQNNDVIDTASTESEYKMKILQAKQQKLLNAQWIKANYDIDNQSLAGLNDVKLMYRDCDLMDGYPEIGTALDIFAEESTFINDNGYMINVSSKSDRVKSILQDLFVNRLSINTTLPMFCRSMCKYGNTFVLLKIDNQNGVTGWKQLPVYEIERYENGMLYPYSTVSPLNMNNTDNLNTVEDTKFVWITQPNALAYQNFQIAHFRLLYDSQFLPYGVSILHKARRHFRMLSMMEDMMLIYRLDRSVERRVFKVNVGAIDEADVPAYIQEIANNFKRTPIIDPLTGQVDTRKNLMNQMEDFFIPVREDNTSSPIETLSAGQNLTAMDDIKYIQNKILTALRVPKSFLNFEESQGDGKNLSLMDVRFTRTVNRIQQALLMELNKIAIIHLYLLGFTDELTNFTLTMNNPSSQAEMLELENLAKKVTTAKDAVSDPGGGIPLTSLSWAWKHIFKWSDKEIQQNLDEIRLEAALAAELQKTTQIIKKTGLFDNVDNIYGEPGAEYSETSTDGGEENGGIEGGGVSGGMPIGGGDLDFGDEGADEEIGNEGEMDMDNAVEEDNNMNAEDNTDVTPNLGEMFLRNVEKKRLNEEKILKKRMVEKTSHYNDLLFQRLIDKLSKKQNESKNETTNVPVYSKAFFINEELDTMSRELGNFTEKLN